MNRQTFQKIWIVIIFISLFTGGVLVWQHGKRTTIRSNINLPEETKKTERIEEPYKTPILEAITINSTTTKLATIPLNIATEIMELPFFSPDGTKVAYAVPKDGKWTIMVNGEGGKLYDDVMLFPFSNPFSPNSKKLAYIAQKDGKFFVVINGEEGEKYERIEIWSLVFSPDSQKIAYVANKNGKQFLVVNGKEGKYYDKILPYLTIEETKNHFAETLRTPVFSPDSQKIAYIAQREGKWFVIIDDKEYGPYNSVSGLSFSPDGQHITYLAYTEKGVTRIIDGKETEIVGPIAFGPDGKIAYVTWKNNQQFIIINGVEKEVKGNSPIIELVLSPDGKRIAYRTENFIGIDGKEGNIYDWVGKPVFSPDSQRIAYVAKKGGKWFVAIDGKEEVYEDLLDPYSSTIVSDPIVFSPDSQKVAYRAKRNNKMFIVVNGKEGKEYNYVYPPVFSPDGKYIAYGAILLNKDKNEVEFWWTVEELK